MARGKRHSDELRAKVYAELVAGSSCREIAEKHGLAESLIREWRRQLPKEQIIEVRRQKKERIEDLIEEFCRVLTDGCIKLVEKTAYNQQWLDRQEAAGLANFLGVCADKALRILEAVLAAKADLQPSNSAEPEAITVSEAGQP